MNTQLVNRIKSFFWRAGMMALAAGVAYMVTTISTLELSPSLTAVLGLILGEVSKYLNTQVQ